MCFFFAEVFETNFHAFNKRETKAKLESNLLSNDEIAEYVSYLKIEQYVWGQKELTLNYASESCENVPNLDVITPINR